MNCRACRSDRLDPVFTMDPMPLAGSFPRTRELAQALPTFPLTWLLCHDCGLVNVEPDIPDDVIYRTYSYAASTVPALVRHHAEFASVLGARYTEPVRLLEIGGNDGVLLNQLPESWTLFNVDPSDVAVNAPMQGYMLMAAPFHGDQWPAAYFDVVTSSNAFAHFTDIAGALDGVARVLKPGGEFWVEVHDLDSTLRSGQWDTIYHEHKVEWSIDSLGSAMARHRLALEQWWRIPLHGGSIRAMFRKGIVGRGRFDKDFTTLQRAYDERKAPPLMAHSAAYGAAARASVYLNQMPGLPIDYVVDGSPLRAGHFVPGVGLPILTPEVFEQDKPETTLITAWNHAADIRSRHPGYEGWVSAW